MNEIFSPKKRRKPAPPYAGYATELINIGADNMKTANQTSLCFFSIPLKKVGPSSDQNFEVGRSVVQQISHYLACLSIP